jgi:hypothetical protein
MSLKINPLQRQPANMDFASPSQFRFQLLKAPEVEYFVTGVNLPGISFTGDATVNTRFKTIAFMGDTMDFEDLEITFLVNEDLSNYREMHDWMIGIGFPKNNEQFKTASADDSLKPNTSSRTNPSAMTSDASITILTNKNNPKVRVNFTNCYPTSLSGLAYNTQITDTEQLTATVVMKYDLYEFESL